MDQIEVEPELRGPTPRSVRFRPNIQLARLAVALFFSAMPLLILYVVVSDIGELRLLAAHGATATATVTAMHTSSGKSKSYYLSYTFPDSQGAEHSGEASVGSSEYERTSVGDPRLITYGVGRPDVQRLGRVDGSTVNQAVVLGAAAVGFLLLVCGGTILYLERFWRGKLDLLRRGTAVTATITELRTRTTSRTLAPYLITCTFKHPTLGDREYRGNLSVQAGRALEGQTRATVLVDPDQPRTTGVYAELRRAGEVLSGGDSR